MNTTHNASKVESRLARTQPSSCSHQVSDKPARTFRRMVGPRRRAGPRRVIPLRRCRQTGRAPREWPLAVRPDAPWRGLPRGSDRPPPRTMCSSHTGRPSWGRGDGGRSGRRGSGVVDAHTLPCANRVWTRPLQHSLEERVAALEAPDAEAHFLLGTVQKDEFRALNVRRPHSLGRRRSLGSRDRWPDRGPGSLAGAAPPYRRSRRMPDRGRHFVNASKLRGSRVLRPPPLRAEL
jgi:hypothetical protein